MTHLEKLESESIYIIREAHAHFKKIGMLWSVGKDSTVLLWLVRKAFFGHVPFSLIHIDTSFKIPEMIEFRDRLVKEWNLQLIVGQNEGAIKAKQTFPDGKVSRVECCKLLKTNPLKELSQKFEALLVGIRHDEEGTRSKERVFSIRTWDSQWQTRNQPCELWDIYHVEPKELEHVRVHPLLAWREIDIWRYIHTEKIPVIDLYFDRNGKGQRYRSIGCSPCTQPISSTAKTVPDILRELQYGPLAYVPERSVRAQDQEDRGTLERLRQEGYM